MRLCEHDDFQAAITATSREISLPEPFVEKDYYITEVLRIVSEQHGDRIIFKGGTSLSKGWDLIQRLSEDVDLLVVGDKFQPPLGKNRAKKQLETMCERVGEHPGLTYHLHDAERFSGGKTRRDPYGYDPRFAATGFAPTVITEPGVAEGAWPSEERPIESHVARYLRGQGSDDIADDLTAFPVQTLHFRRTFIEKLFIVHALVERLKEEGKTLDRDARHYYDLGALAEQDEVRVMLEGDECAKIKEDCARISLKFFAKAYRAPADLVFAESDGVFPSGDIFDQIEADYEAQCSLLCFGDVPKLETVVALLEELRAHL